MKVIQYVLVLFAFCAVMIAAGPTSEQGNVIYFNAADQETGTSFRVRTVVWTSDEATNADIAADDDFLLEDEDGTRIVGKRAEAAGDGLEIHFGDKGVVSSGLKVEELDGGVVYVIGDRL